jgi:hypothetical protein
LYFVTPFDYIPLANAINLQEINFGTHMQNLSDREILIVKGFELYDWLTPRLDGLEIKKGKRVLLAIGCLDQAIEHHAAICCLLKNKINGSAFALVRLIFESFVRGVWLKNCASEIQLSEFQNDKLNISFGELVRSIEELEGFRSGMLGRLKKQAWSAMNSYTHTGFQQASRRFGKEHVEPTYTDAEVIEVLKISGSFALLSFQQIAAEGNRLDLAQEANELLAGTMESFQGTAAT